MAESDTTSMLAREDEKRKILTLFKEESAKCDDWKSKYIANSMFVLGAGAFGSVFQVTTRLYLNKQKMYKNRYVYHPNFLSTLASQRKVKPELQDKLRDPNRDSGLLDIVAIKYEILQQGHLEDGATRFYLFLRREFLVLDTMWQKNHRIMHGFPSVFDFGYVGDKSQFGVNPKYRNIFTYLNIEGEEVKFFTDGHNRNLEGVTKISYMSMELLGPSIDDFRCYFEPWYNEANIKAFFNVRTVFKIADQTLCRLLVLHKSGFVHHDIKPDNIAFGNGRAMNIIYLLDFGFSKQVSNAHCPEWMGSRKFISVDTYNGAKPNYAQDIESWFYLVFSLLYDALPWTDEFINPILGDRADENARWNMVIQMKKSWWGELSEAVSLKDMIKSITALHSAEVPDIKAILEQLHKRTRELRSTMRTIDDAQTLNFELANNQSTIFKNYMSIRKALLQIFNLPNIGKNVYLGDSEFRSMQETRAEKKYPSFNWDPHNYEWEWDINHRNLTQKQGMADVKYVMEQLNPANQHSSIANQSLYKCRESLNSLLVMGRSKMQRPDEVSYAFDRQRLMLLPKCNGHQYLNASQAPLPFYNDNKSDSNDDDFGCDVTVV